MGLALATWLQGRPEVDRVLYPALPDDPGHAVWKRDFTGASGLFGVVLKDTPRDGLAAMLDGMELFAMGDSWGRHPRDSWIAPDPPSPKPRMGAQWYVFPTHHHVKPCKRCWSISARPCCPW